MAKKYSELRAKMSPERRAAADRKADEMAAKIATDLTDECLDNLDECIAGTDPGEPCRLNTQILRALLTEIRERRAESEDGTRAVRIESRYMMALEAELEAERHHTKCLQKRLSQGAKEIEQLLNGRRKLLARIASMRESYDLLMGDESPLPDLAKGVVRGAFITCRME